MTKKIWTVAEAISRVQAEMDLEEETFLKDPDDYIIFINDAIDEAEAEIHGLNEDYMLTSSTLDIVSGTKQYALPNTIYANKLKHVQFKRNSTDMHKVRRIAPHKVAWAEESTLNDPEWYLIRNDGTADGVEIEFYPTPTTSTTGGITLWYLRNAERVAATTDLIDLPEFASFVFAYMKYRVAAKEMSPVLDNYLAELQNQRDLMKRTLSQMIVDPQETLPKDMSFYADFDHTFNGYDFW